MGHVTPFKCMVHFAFSWAFLLSPSTAEHPWSSVAVTDWWDFPEAHCTRGFHSCTLGIVEEGSPRTGMPYMFGVHSTLYGELRGQIQQKAGTPYRTGDSEHGMWQDKVQRSLTPYLGGSPGHGRWQGKRLFIGSIWMLERKAWLDGNAAYQGAKAGSTKRAAIAFLDLLWPLKPPLLESNRC